MASISLKRILVIGATSSIAEHCGRLWASRGNTLYLVARNEDRLNKFAAELRIKGATETYSYCMDLNAIDSHSTMLDAAEKL